MDLKPFVLAASIGMSDIEAGFKHSPYQKGVRNNKAAIDAAESKRKRRAEKLRQQEAKKANK